MIGSDSTKGDIIWSVKYCEISSVVGSAWDIRVTDFGFKINDGSSNQCPECNNSNLINNCIYLGKG